MALPPRNISVSPTGRKSLLLSWAIPSETSNLSGYEIEISDETGTVFPHETVSDSLLSYEVKGLQFNRVYRFRIKSNEEGGGMSDFSLPVYGIPEPVSERIVPQGFEIPMTDSDRQSVIARIDSKDCKITVWWQPSDNSWWGSLEVPANTPAVSSARLALDSGLLDRVGEILPGNIVMRETGSMDLEPGRNAWRRKTHRLMWEPAA